MMKPIFKRDVVTLTDGTTVHVREPSAGAAIKLARMAQDAKEHGNKSEDEMLRSVLRAGVTDENGHYAFKEGGDDPLEFFPVKEAMLVAEKIQAFMLVEVHAPGNSEASPSGS